MQSSDEPPLRSDRDLKRQDELDKEDFANELAGVDAGRARRFLPEFEHPKARRKREEQAQRQFWPILALHTKIQRFTARLDELDRTSILALNEADLCVAAAEEYLEEMRRLATKDDQGHTVYRSADERTAFYEDAGEVG